MKLGENFITFQLENREVVDAFKTFSKKLGNSTDIIQNTLIAYQFREMTLEIMILKPVIERYIEQVKPQRIEDVLNTDNLSVLMEAYNDEIRVH